MVEAVVNCAIYGSKSNTIVPEKSKKATYL
jgi:hypothetical protein